MRRKFVNCINLKLNNEPLHIERIAHCIHTTNLIIYIAMYNARLYLNFTMYNVRCTKLRTKSIMIMQDYVQGV